MKQSIGDYFSGVSQDLSKNGKSILILLAVTILPVQAILVIVDGMLDTPVSDTGLGFIFSSMGFLGLLFIIARTFFDAGFLSLLSKDVKADDYKKALKNGNTRFWHLLGLMFIGVIMLMAGYFLFIIPGIYLTIALMYSIIVVVIEKKGIFESISRSFELVRKRWWKTFGRTLPLVGIFIIWGLASPYIPEVAYLTTSINYLVNDFLQILVLVWVYRMYLDAKKTVIKK